MNLVHLPPFPAAGLVRVVIETPKYSRNKLGYDPKLKVFAFDKTLPEGMVFPYDFGFIPQTLGEDGDPLDALVLMPEALPTGSVIDGRLIGVVRATQSEKHHKPVRNDRFLVVGEDACEFSRIKTVEDMPRRMLDELVEFFINYNQLERRKFKLLGVDGPKRALTLIRTGRRKPR